MPKPTCGADLASVQKEPVYRYLFAHSLENDPALKSARASHTIEHAFLFPQRRYAPTDNDRIIQRQMVDYWTRMARTGNPNGGDDSEWPAVSSTNDAYLEIGATTVAKKGAASANCDFWGYDPVHLAPRVIS
jgi:para-nitrobenzyl esterase